MDEWVVYRPHQNRLRRIVREAGQRQAKRRCLLAPRVRVDDDPGGGGHLDPPWHDGQYRTQITFGREPNHGIQKALSRC